MAVMPAMTADDAALVVIAGIQPEEELRSRWGQGVAASSRSAAGRFGSRRRAPSTAEIAVQDHAEIDVESEAALDLCSAWCESGRAPQTDAQSRKRIGRARGLRRPKRQADQKRSQKERETNATAHGLQQPAVPGRYW